MSRSLAAVVMALVGVSWTALAPAPVRAIEVDWGEPTATARFGEEIAFEQPATLPAGVRRAELLLVSTGNDAPLVIEVGAPRSGNIRLSHTLDISVGHIFPNVAFTARWRIVGDDGSEALGPEVGVTYADTRFDWQTREGDLVRVHWYEGTAEFGDRALAIGERAVEETAALMGVTEDEPIDFYVYASEEDFRLAIGPGNRENVGGLAPGGLRTLYALIPPGQIDDPWVGSVIPHELVHLVFATAIDNPYHEPARWLNEGLAVYLSDGYGVSDRAAVQQAASDGSLIPLEGLAGQFPTTFERFSLAYSESVAAVDFFVRQHGQDALVQLVRSYATGLTDDEAFERAIGMDTEAFDAAWRGELNAREPTEYGPQPPPAGPLPPGWQMAEPSPRSSGAPGPGGSPQPGAPLPTDGSGGGAGLLFPLALVVSGLVAVAIIVWVTRGRRRAEEQRVAQFAAWRAERPAPAANPEPDFTPPPAPGDPVASSPSPVDPPYAETAPGGATIPIETWPRPAGPVDLPPHPGRAAADPPPHASPVDPPPPDRPPG